MDTALWSSVDDFFNRTLIGEDPVLADVLARSEAADLPAISVSIVQGKLLQILAASIGARRILEIGTLGGFSTIWLARGAGPDGKVVTIDFAPRHAAVARESFQRAGLTESVQLIEGVALDVLPRLQGTADVPFDFVFIDADKPSTPAYFEWALRLSRPGALIIIDNVVRHGELGNPGSQDASAIAMRSVCEQIGRDPRVSATALQTVGSKGYDGFLIARVVKTS